MMIRSHQNSNIYRKIEWTHKGTWEHPGKAVTKTLTDITQYTDYVKQLNAIFEDNSTEQKMVLLDEQEEIYDSYTKDDFLQDVYMSEERYNTLTNLLLTKKISFFKEHLVSVRRTQQKDWLILLWVRKMSAV